jgi:hypothetical protein
MLVQQPIKLTNGKWRRRDGIAVTVTVGERSALVELHDNRAYVISLNGRRHQDSEADSDITEKGWPLELVAGKWYRDSIGTVGFLVSMPEFCRNEYWLVCNTEGDSYFVQSDGTIRFYDGRKIVEEATEPDWAKEKEELPSPLS